MITIEYGSSGLNDNTLPDFIQSVSQHQYGKKITLNDNYATGDFKVLEFSNGFYAYVSNYIVNEDFIIQLPVRDEAYLALHINQVQAGAVFTITLNSKVVSYNDKILSSLFLTCSSDDLTVSGTKGACVNRLKIMVPKTWLASNLPFYNEALLQAYFDLQEERLFADALDTTYRSMVDKVMNTEDNAVYLTVTQHIIAVITERFFNRLQTKMQKNRQALN